MHVQGVCGQLLCNLNSVHLPLLSDSWYRSCVFVCSFCSNIRIIIPLMIWSCELSINSLLTLTQSSLWVSSSPQMAVQPLDVITRFCRAAFLIKLPSTNFAAATVVSYMTDAGQAQRRRGGAGTFSWACTVYLNTRVRGQLRLIFIYLFFKTVIKMLSKITIWKITEIKSIYSHRNSPLLQLCPA